MPSPSTVVGLFADRVRRFPQRPFVEIMQPDGSVDRCDYLGGAARVVGLADALLAAGLKKGDRLVLYLDAGDPNLWLFLACAAAGIIPVPLGPTFSVEGMVKLAQQCRASAIFAMPEDVARLVDAGLPIFTPRETPGARCVRGTPATDPLARLDAFAGTIVPDDVYEYQPTSGSTGVPKIVMRRNITFPYAGRVMAAGLDETSPLERGLLALSLTHGAGQYSLYALLHCAACICISTRVDTQVPLAEVEALRPTSIVLVPRVMRALFAQHREKYGDAAAGTPFCGGQLRWIGIGGAPPDDAIFAELDAFGIEAIEGYGATEISLLAMNERGRRRPGTVGKIRPEVEVHIAADGEVMARSPFRMAGYLDDDAQTRAAFDPDGFYHTGDLGEITADGCLRIRGRKKDVFNSSEGSNIYPTRIEEMLENTPGIKNAILVGDMRPYVTALVVPADLPAGDGALLDHAAHHALYESIKRGIAAINARLERFEQIRRVAILGAAFDPTAYAAVGQGKLRRDRKRITELYAPIIRRLYDASSTDLVV